MNQSLWWRKSSGHAGSFASIMVPNYEARIAGMGSVSRASFLPVWSNLRFQ
jgi:hypothetical protein